MSDLINAEERWPVLESPQPTQYCPESEGIAAQVVFDTNRTVKPEICMLTWAIRPAGTLGEGDPPVTMNIIAS